VLPNRGSAINSIFQTMLMNVAPVVFDIAIATSKQGISLILDT
jgi:hypothetical protein